MTVVNKIACLPDNAKIFDGIETSALMKTDNEDAGAVLAITKVVDEEGNVDLLLCFPTEQVESTGEPTGTYQPTAIRMTLNTFLNTARMLAIQHQAVVGEMPEAITDDECPGSIVIPGRSGIGGA